ncbi:hypothetical protein SK803_35515 [Lentzea sp. BCCO 10_0856]|uniref:Ig-like domain-containing protein n=1 Tax=Lentzea miocenica TaxID=3095431 RepID=A0ABU4TBS9_9PSEU|nr:hypothetical protein [Lentzea sp. BCCO 10_0856]MDX8035545.1 hypothetical protein [Lentzea sp. BCCO 10_0856]
MKRPVIAGAAVLCLLAAQPASAAWQTSAPGTAKAKAGTVQALVITSCVQGTPTAVRWEAVPGASMYTVLWQQGNGANAPYANSGTTSALTYSVPDSISRVRVQATVGTWATNYTQINCS